MTSILVLRTETLVIARFMWTQPAATMDSWKQRGSRRLRAQQKTGSHTSHPLFFKSTFHLFMKLLPASTCLCYFSQISRWRATHQSVAQSPWQNEKKYMYIDILHKLHSLVDINPPLQYIWKKKCFKPLASLSFFLTILLKMFFFFVVVLLFFFLQQFMRSNFFCATPAPF